MISGSLSIQRLLGSMGKIGASDLHIKVGIPPTFRINGVLRSVQSDPVTEEEADHLLDPIVPANLRARFEETGNLDFATHLPDGDRFRVNMFRSGGHTHAAIRRVKADIPTYQSLHLPAIYGQLVETTNEGLILVTGVTGCGKSTTLAAMIEHVNNREAVNIITVEDPVEFVHAHKNCIVTQREIGLDTDGWEIALKNTLRQAPDVILMGEIRDRETMENAVAFAETGHLCLATLHANSANQALDRIINFFPEERRQQLLMDLSLNLKALISQRLIPRESGRGRIAAVEIMLNTPLVSDMIFKGEIAEIKDLMKRSRELGMQTFDQSLFELYEGHLISYEDALRNADSVNDLRLQIKLQSQRARSADLSAGTEHMKIV